MRTLATRQPIHGLLQDLHAKFAGNIKILPQETIEILEDIDTRCRIIDSVRAELVQSHSNNDPHRVGCAELVGEVFADLAQAMYLISAGLIVPGRMVTRRAFELGIASVYMWDMPHEYWGWAKCDEDLSFTKMVSHLSSSGYKVHLSTLQGKNPPDGVCESASFQKIYRSLSNTVHGKAESLPPLSPERFSAAKNGLNEHLKLISEVQDALSELWCGRFVGLKEHIKKQNPKVGKAAKK
jgi:hypothetical protein